MVCGYVIEVVDVFGVVFGVLFYVDDEVVFGGCVWVY